MENISPMNIDQNKLNIITDKLKETQLLREASKILSDVVTDRDKLENKLKKYDNQAKLIIRELENEVTIAHKSNYELSKCLIINIMINL